MTYKNPEKKQWMIQNQYTKQTYLNKVTILHIYKHQSGIKIFELEFNKTLYM